MSEQQQQDEQKQHTTIDEAIYSTDYSKIDFDALENMEGVIREEQPVLTEEAFGGILENGEYVKDFYEHEGGDARILLDSVKLKIKSEQTEFLTIKLAKYKTVSKERQDEEEEMEVYEKKTVLCKEELDYQFETCEKYVSDGEFICIEVFCETKYKVLVEGEVRHRLL